MANILTGSIRNDVTERTTDTPSIRSRKAVLVGWVALLSALILLWGMTFVPSPYVIERPGPVFNTLDVIEVEGEKTYPTEGALDLLTVSVLGSPRELPSWGSIIQAWFDPSQAVIPLDSVYSPNETVDQRNEQNQVLMADSQQEAIAAALTSLGFDYAKVVSVVEVNEGLPAEGVVQGGDEIVSVNGVAIDSVESLRAQLTSHGSDEPVVLTVIRAGSPQTLTLTPARVDGAVVIGIRASMKYDFPFTVTITLEDVGGPSAGMMFALGIIDTLTPGELTGAEHIAGTGTITADGQVGAIGGIRQKMYAAQRAGARWFLAPASNCDEVVGYIPAGLNVFAVHTLQDSLQVLDAIRTEDSTDSLPRCES